MEVNIFIQNFKEAFGNKPNLPIVFWYSEIAVEETEAPRHCFFSVFDDVNKGTIVSLNADNMRCAGGKFYTGFTDMPEFVPKFVSTKERYKKTPEMVLDYVDKLGVPKAKDKFLNFARIDKVESFDGVEGILFLATPDVLSGLATWAYFDNNAEDCVSSIFGSGCATVVTQAVVENRNGGRRTFLGLFDPSVRPQIDANVLSFVIPMSRFGEMYHTMRESCLFDTLAWGKVRDRINS